MTSNAQRGASPRRSARERLLDAADELFYAEGVHSVGIDRVIERADVARATLYRVFGSKEQLVAAYLAERHQRIAERLRQGVDGVDDPRERLLAVFYAQSSILSGNYQGCAFTRAVAEPSSGPAVAKATEAYRAEVLALLTSLAEAAGARDPQELGRQLFAVYHGGAVLTGDTARPEFRESLIKAAEGLIDAALTNRPAAAGDTTKKGTT